MGNVVFQTASELARRGHDVEVFTPQYGRSRSTGAPYSEQVAEREDFAHRLSAPVKYGNAAYLPSITKKLDAFDLVHLHYPFFGTANLVRRWKNRNPKKPLVITYHMDARSPSWKGIVFSLYAKLWMPKILGAANRIIVSSHDYAGTSQAWELFQKHKKYWVEIPFGVDVERFTPRTKPDGWLESVGLSSDVPTVLFVGGLDQAHFFKGVPVLLKAVLSLKKTGTPVQVIFAGGGELKEKYMQQAHGYGLSSVVKFIGRVTDEALPFWYNAADLFVLPSTTTGEAFGMVLLEAMASGVPVIASDLPGVRKVAEDGGVTFPASDYRALAREIHAYFSDEVDREAFGKEVRNMAEQKYGWGSVTDQLEEVYRELV